MAKQKERLKLTRAEKKQLKALIARNQQKGRKGPRTAQDTIPYQRMWPDGICRVSDNYYTKTIQFQDINYQLAQNDDKTSIFEGWCDFLNYFDAAIHLQFSFLNLTASAESFEQSIIIPERDDGFNDVRHEYAEMLQSQLAKGNNGLTKTKFITFGIEAEKYRTAKPRLERIEIDLMNNFKRLGVAATSLDGYDRLRLMHDMFHMDTQAPFQFDWKWLPPTGLSTKDFIVPSSFDFKARNTFGMGNKQGEISFFSILASDLNDRCLADFLALLIFMTLDYITGVMCAIVDKKLSSAVGFKGVCKKVLILFMVGIANIVDLHVIGSGSALRGAVIAFYLSNEGLSLLENAAYIGLPIPDKLKAVLEQLHNRDEKEGKQIDQGDGE